MSLKKRVRQLEYVVERLGQADNSEYALYVWQKGDEKQGTIEQPLWWRQP